MLHTSLAFKTSAGCAFTCLFCSHLPGLPFANSFILLNGLLYFLNGLCAFQPLPFFRSSSHHSNHVSPLLCCPLSVLLSFLRAQAFSKKPPSRPQLSLEDLCLCFSCALGLGCLALQVEYLDRSSVNYQVLRTVFLPLYPRV